MLGALAFAALYVLPVHSFAVVSVDDAYSTAQREAGVPLDPTPMYNRSGAEPSEVLFATAAGVEPKRVHRIWLADGSYSGYNEAPPQPVPSPESITREWATGTAKAAARGRMPDDVPEMDWQVREDEGAYEVTGSVVPPPGAPRGPSTSCTVSVSRTTGAVSYFEIRFPTPQPVTVAVTADAAVAAARALLGRPNARVVREPYLWAAPQGAEWHVRLSVPESECVAIHVDGNTGVATEVGRTAGAGERPSADTASPFGHAPAGPTSRAQPMAVAVGSAAVLALAGTALVVRRRRRAA